MCGLVGSSNQREFLDLLELNTYRGNNKFSISFLKDNFIRTIKYDKPFNRSEVQLLAKADYYIGHTVAATNNSIDNIHPAISENVVLWHNGMLKSTFTNCFDCKWDTKIFADLIMEKDSLIQGIESILGTFACLCFFKGELFVFRNAASILTYQGSTISSTKLDRSIKPNIIYKVDIKNNKLEEIDKFKYKDEIPYFFIGEAE